MSHHGESEPRDRVPLRERIPSYLTGDLSEAEERELERLLAEDPALEREVREWSEALAELAASGSTPIEPAAGTRRDLLERIAEAAAARGRAPGPGPEASAGAAPALPFPSGPRRGARVQLALAASIGALVLALGAVWVQVSTREQVESLRAERDALTERVEALESEQVLAQRRVDQLAAAVRAVVDPGRQPVLLASLGDPSDASGAAFYRRAGAGALFYAFGLPRLGDDRTYQLWYIGEQGPVSAGTFEVDERGEATVAVAEVPPPEAIAAWAVTVEPAGGVPQPTGPMVIRS